MKLTHTHTLTCTTCNIPRIRASQDEIGLHIDPNPTPGSHDTVQAAVNRTMQGAFSPGADCPRPTCKAKEVTYNSQFTVNAAPEYLRIHINLLHHLPVYNENETPKIIGTLPVTDEAKEINPIQIDDLIDLTSHMAFHDANA
jgi:hypothetical protein